MTCRPGSLTPLNRFALFPLSAFIPLIQPSPHPSKLDVFFYFFFSMIFHWFASFAFTEISPKEILHLPPPFILLIGEHLNLHLCDFPHLNLTKIFMRLTLPSPKILHAAFSQFRDVVSPDQTEENPRPEICRRGRSEEM
ncbi:hypothetical protein F2P56_019821 [Juglans regia]|uniref:Uncharacterized protein n=1 Tax=Juglans regia TaxID=51240 RepID=A0A833UPE2_JUGRE|nr:hypothetical protein F2P56_019821 [Juglans regia]